MDTQIDMAKSETARVLIIGESSEYALSLTEDLTRSGYHVVHTGTGRQALSRWQGGNFDAIILSTTLPDMESVEVIRQIHPTESERNIPVLLFSAVQEMATVERCFEQGAEAVLWSECYSPVLLKTALEHALQHKRLCAQLVQSHQEQAIAQKLANDLTQIILPIGLSLSKIKQFERLLEKILRETKAICNADGGTLYLRDGDFLKFILMLNDSLGIAITSTHDTHLLPPPLPLHDDHGKPNHRHVATSTALLGLSINIPDAYQVENTDFSGTRNFDRQYHYRSVASLTVPLKDHDGEVFGVLQLINPHDPDTGQVVPFDSYMQQVAEALASLATLVLSNQILLERQKELLRVEDELKIGRQIQISFLPESLPECPGWEIAARLRSARSVSGDFYDVFPLHDNPQICLVIADICGKGVGAALFMVLVRTLIRAFVESGRDGKTTLRHVIEATNAYIFHNHYQTNMFATLFIGILTPATGELAYVNNGHPAPVLLRAKDRSATLAATGPAIGAFRGIDFTVQQVNLEAEDMLFAFTDGVTDARNPDGERFTTQRLWKMLETSSALAATALLDGIEEHIQAHTAGADQFDDMTMLAIRRNPRIASIARVDGVHSPNQT